MAENEQSIVESPKKKLVIKNPSLEEIEAMRHSSSTQAVTEEEMKTKIEKENPPQLAQKIVKNDNNLLKPKTSAFEPDSYPFTLISGNKFVNVQGNIIHIRRMGAAEESMFYQLLSHNNMRAINNTIDAVICNCVKTNIDTYDLSLNDKLPIFFKIIDLTYGPIELEMICDECGKASSVKVDLVKDLKTLYLPISMNYPAKIKLTSFPEANIYWYIGVPTIKQSSDYFDETVINVLKMLTIKFEGTIKDNGVNRDVTEHDYMDIITNLNETDIDAFKNFQNDFGQYSTSLDFNTKLCTNKSCTFVGREVQKQLPIESIFERIVRIQQK